MVDDTLNLKAWLSKLTPDQIDRSRVRSPDDIAGLIAFNDLRADAESVLNLGPKVPTDIFVLALGEPDFRAATKVGGLPYRPANRPWPTAPNGTPLTFLAQFCFQYEHSFFRELPGDVLLVFVKDEDLVTEWLHDEQMLFEWYPLGLSDLVTAENVAEPAWTFVTCYGVRYRSYDFLNSEPTPELLEFLSQRFPESYDSERYTWARGILRIDSLKIGGLPYCQRTELFDADRELQGELLATISYIMPWAKAPYPWINVPEAYPHWSECARDENRLAILDSFSIYFMRDPIAGAISWKIRGP